MNKPKRYLHTNVKGCKFGTNVSIGDFSRLYSSILGSDIEIGRCNYIKDCTIGRYTYTGQNCHLIGTEVGNFCSISWNVTIGGGEHEYDRVAQHKILYDPKLLKKFGNKSPTYQSNSAKTQVGHDVWIGANAFVKQGINIGNGAVVGAGAVVTKSIPEYAVVTGNPAKILRYRFSEKRMSELKKLQWWNWSDEEISKGWLTLVEKSKNHE